MEKYLGLDLGTKSLGIAGSDSLGIVHPKENFNFEKGNYKKAREHLLDIIEIENVKNIVIGYLATLSSLIWKKAKDVNLLNAL